MSRTRANTLIAGRRLTNRSTGIGKPRSIVATRACDAGFSATVLWLDILKMGMISQLIWDLKKLPFVVIPTLGKLQIS